MRHVIVHQCKDGAAGMAVTVPSPEYIDGQREPYYDPDTGERLYKKTMEQAIREYGEFFSQGMTDFYVVERASLPDPDFQGAWKWNEKKKKVEVSDAAARDIQFSRIRARRNDKLKELDAESLRFLGDAEKLSEIEGRKQALRDLPETVGPDLGATKGVEQIKAVWPQELS